MDRPTDRQGIDDGLSVGLQQGRTPVAERLSRMIGVVTGNQQERGSQLTDPGLDRVDIDRTISFLGRSDR
jgi:hypothetical protein